MRKRIAMPDGLYQELARAARKDRLNRDNPGALARIMICEGLARRAAARKARKAA